MPRAHGARAQMALAYEATYGTAPASGYHQMPFASSALGDQQALIESELLGYGRDPLAPIKDALVVDGDIVVPLCARSIGHWLKLLFGQPTTTGTGSNPRVHAYNSGGWVLPSAAIEIGMPEVPQFSMYRGVRADRLSISMQRAGQLQATVGLIGQQVTPATATAAGSPAAIALQRLGHFNGSIQRNGSALANVVSAELTYSNGLDRIETIRADGAIDGVDPGMARLTGRMDVRFADTILLDQAIAGDPCSLRFGWTLAAGVSLVIEAHAVYLPRPRREIPGPQGIQVSFDWQAARAVDPARMATVTLTNDVTAY